MVRHGVDVDTGSREIGRVVESLDVSHYAPGMGFLKRLFEKPVTAVAPWQPDLSAYEAASADFERAVASITVTVTSPMEHETLYVVGESYRQDTLWRLVGGVRRETVRHPIVAELRPDPDNEHDRNAIAVLIGGQVVGYLSRQDAALYKPGIERLTAARGRVELHGWICGGGQRPDGFGQLGVFLDHDPADFGVREPEPEHPSLADVPASYGFRTGLSSARATDLEDDSYDLSWIDQLSPNVATAIGQLRKLLDQETDPIDLHFMYAELEARLYGCRDAFGSALDEYDDVCRRHDAAMNDIRAALFEKFSRLPILEVYKQSAIRCAKARDWEGVERWCERGLAVYGTSAANPDVVEDLRTRLTHAHAKIEARDHPKARRTASRTEPADAVIESFVCEVCGVRFERVRTRGRKPHACPSCRGLASA
jgi:rubrerythrin